MKAVRLLVVPVVVVLLGTALVVEANEKKAVTRAADALTWEDFSPQRPGVKMAKISGDHFQGSWKAFVRYPAGAKAKLHSHGADLELVVVSGSFHLGDGSGEEKRYGPGSYLFIPAGMPHTNSTTEETTLFESQPGKFDTTPVAAAAAK